MLCWDLTFWSLIIVIVQCEIVNRSNSNQCANVKTDLSAIRKRRHITFPDKSIAAIVIALAPSIPTHVPSGWYLILELEVLYPLPDSNFTNSHFRRKLHHRQKREMWDRLKDGLLAHNMNGQECVLKSVCDAKVHLAPPGVSLVHDLLRAIFTAPLHEADFVDEVGGIYNEILDPNVCDRVHDCPISVINFILQLNKQQIFTYCIAFGIQNKNMSM